MLNNNIVGKGGSDEERCATCCFAKFFEEDKFDCFLHHQLVEENDWCKGFIHVDEDGIDLVAVVANRISLADLSFTKEKE